VRRRSRFDSDVNGFAAVVALSCRLTVLFLPRGIVPAIRRLDAAHPHCEGATT
jgi:hypothetical protein